MTGDIVTKLNPVVVEEVDTGLRRLLGLQNVDMTQVLRRRTRDHVLIDSDGLTKCIGSMASLGVNPRLLLEFTAAIEQSTVTSELLYIRSALNSNGKHVIVVAENAPIEPTISKLAKPPIK